MEFTFESALSPQGLLGHLAYVVLIASMLMRTLLWLRVLVITSALLGIVYSSLILHDPVSTFWETLLVLVNILQILRSHWRTLRARFTSEEEALRKLHLDGLSRGEARTILDTGAWVSLPEGSVLSVEAEAVEYLHYIATGATDVVVGGQKVAECTVGHFVGEMTVVDGLPSTATVVVTSPTALVWRVEASALRRKLDQNDLIARTLDAAFARNYRDKLARMNRLAAGLGQPAS
mgnify:CR=1 FL=1